MVDSESTESELGLSRLQRLIAAQELAEKPDVVPVGWRGNVSELEVGALEAFWIEALRYAQWEIGCYARWREQAQPVLASGYDAEGIVQACFERLIYREAGGVPILYSAEDIRQELRSLIKHRVRWLHARHETRLVVGEWDLVPPGEEGELISVMDYLPGRIEAPDRQIMRKEKEQLLGEFKGGFESTLGNREELVKVFQGAWDGQKRRVIAEAVGTGTERVKALQAQLRGRLAKFCAQARGGVREVLEGVREGE
jgi:hypothetical protein